MFVFGALVIYGAILCMNCVWKDSKVNRGFNEGGGHLCDKIALFVMPFSFVVYITAYTINHANNRF